MEKKLIVIKQDKWRNGEFFADIFKDNGWKLETINLSAGELGKITRARQEIVMSEIRVTGIFKYKDIFQMRPIYSDAPVLEWPIGHHPFLLEHKYTVPHSSETKYNPELPEWVLSTEIDHDSSDKTKKWILLALSMFSKFRVFQYPAEHDSNGLSRYPTIQKT